MIAMRAKEPQTEPGGIERRVGVGIRLKLFGFLLPLVFLLITSMTLVVTEVTKDTLHNDLLQRGAAISRVVALSAGYSLLANDPLGLDTLVSKTKAGDPDIAFVAIRDASDNVVAHNILTERGKPYRSVPPLLPLATFGDTRADEVVRDGQRLFEYTTPIYNSPVRPEQRVRVGIASLGLSMQGLATAQRSIRQRIYKVAGGILVIAFFGTLLLSSLITTPVKRLHRGVLSLAGSDTFQPVPARTSDELGALTRNFNRMAETILAQKTTLEKRARQLEDAYVSMMHIFADLLDARDPDPYTIGHSTRVARMSCMLGRRLGMGEEELSNLELAAIFHDLGKIQTPQDVLRKGEPLSPSEEEQMKTHLVDGTALLRSAPLLEQYIPVVRAHHEWYNGAGYPDGIKGDEIPRHAQIIALADAFDAMTTDRPYREALSSEEAIEEILQFRGTQFSPELADTFARMVREMPPMDETTLKSMAL
jgi:putative nucleotidyltransferase with HDIG domain